MEELKAYYLKVVINNFANFDGRAGRKEFWYFTLINIVVFGILSVLSALSDFLFFLYPLYGLAVLIPSLAVTTRRLHDTNRSAWYIILAFVPFVNLYILYLMLLKGDKGENKYGPEPDESMPQNTAII